MNINQFLDALFSSGEILIASPTPASEEELRLATDQLIEQEISYRETLPLTPPEFDPALAAACCLQIYQALQFLGFRDIESDTIDASLSTVARTTGPRSHYSADVVFRFLPQLAPYFSKNNDQQLSDYFDLWVKRWPLSSVGIKPIPTVPTPTVRNHDQGEPSSDSHHNPPPASQETSNTSEPLSVSGFWTDECLRSLYLDRIIARQADDRIDATIAIALKQRVGIHASLLDPKIALLINSEVGEEL